MPTAIRMYETGGPEVLRWEDHDPGLPGRGEVLIQQEAIGLNFIDVYHRTGLYPLPSLPAIPGMEGAGHVLAVGPAVSDFTEGDRVAYAGVPPGAYAQQRLIPAHRLVALPESLSFEEAAAVMLQGMTARYLLVGCYPVSAGDTILVHAAAGGVGSLLCQWASSLGATVIGTAGNAQKAEIAKKNGCAHPLLYADIDWTEAVREITGGRGVDVVYDSVGQATFLQSLDCLRPLGTMVSFGQASGPVKPFEPGLLAAKGSLFLTRPSLMTYTDKREDLLSHAADLFERIQSGAVQVRIDRRYPLPEVAQAHRDLEARRTSGSCILLPD